MKVGFEFIGSGTVVVVDGKIEGGCGVFVEVGNVGGSCGVGGELAG